MVEDKSMVLLDPKINTYKKMCIIGTEEFNNESMRINVASMICDKNKEFKFVFLLKNASSYVHMKIGKLV